MIGDYKQKVTPHFITYPSLKESEFLSLSLMNYSDIIVKSKEWDMSKPFFDKNELFANDDLTENDIIIRQINCSKIIDRLLQDCLKQAKQHPDDM